MSRPNFIVIGAQKCGTTSLFELLRSNSQVYMPDHKESQYFSNTSYYAKGQDYYQSLFRAASPMQKAGEASPQYMCSREASRRIMTDCGSAKLVAILRDPVARAISHYHMTKRRGRTELSLDEALSASLERSVRDKTEPDMDNDFLVIGEYGRQLSWFERYFKQGAIHVLFLEDLRRDPQGEAAALQEFLELDEAFSIREFPHAHKGGTHRFQALDRFLRESPVVRFLARALLSPEQRKSLSFQYETRLNVKVVPQQDKASPEMRQSLRDYFRDDTKVLEELVGRSAPWES